MKTFCLQAKGWKGKGGRKRLLHQFCAPAQLLCFSIFLQHVKTPKDKGKDDQVCLHVFSSIPAQDGDSEIYEGTMLERTTLVFRILFILKFGWRRYQGKMKNFSVVLNTAQVENGISISSLFRLNRSGRRRV